MALSAQTDYIVPWSMNCTVQGRGTRQTHNKTMEQYTKLKKVEGQGHQAD